MPAAPDPFQGMSRPELQQRFGGYYPPAAPKENPVATAPDTRTPQQLSQTYPEFYPEGASPKISGLPQPTSNPREFMSPDALRQANPEFYDPPTPPAAQPSAVSDLPSRWNVPDSFTGVPEIPVTTPPGSPLGSFLSSPAGSAALTGGGAAVLSGIAGVLSGESPDVAIAQGIGAGIGAVGGGIIGGAAGAVFGPGGAVIGGYLGTGIGAGIGGSLAANLAQSIHDIFFPPSAINHGPLDKVKLPPNVPGGYPAGTIYIVRFASEGRTDEIRMRTYSGAGYAPKGSEFQQRTLSAYGEDIYGNPSPTISPYTKAPISISVIPEVHGVPQKELPQIPDFKQSPYPQDLIPTIPTPQQAVPPLPQVKPPDTIPQAKPKKPPIGIFLNPPVQTPAPIGIFLNPPVYNPAPTETPTPTTSPEPTSTPGQGSQTGTTTGTTTTTKPETKPETKPDTNLNNLPGLMGLPFIPAFLPENTNSPSGSLNTDPDGGPTGSGTPPKAPTNTPCNSPCQRAIEGRIQGVDDKLGQLLGGNQVAQDAALAEILRRLAILDLKVGAQVPNGISGFLGKFREAFDKFSKWIQLDRLLNILTFIVTLQNAYFLTDSLKIVTLQMISDGLAVLGFHDADNNPLNINKMLDKGIEDILKKVLGVDTLEGMKKEWKALSRIYQAGSNIIYAFQNIAWSILNALDIIGSWNAQIGNALKKYGVVGHNAFAWLNPAPNFHNKFFTAVNNALNIVSNIDFVAQSIIQGRNAVDEITKQSDEFQKDFKEVTNPTPAEHKPTADAAKKSATDSHSPAPTNDDLNKVG